jgi:hypothetical protein
MIARAGKRPVLLTERNRESVDQDEILDSLAKYLSTS